MFRLIVLLFFTIIFWSCFTFTSSAAGNQFERLAGKDRFEVAVNVSVKGWAEGSDTILIANYTSFADALAASPFAYKENGPILLTQKDHLHATTRNEILRLQPKRAYIIGGNGSISDEVFREVDKLVEDVERIGGKDRFEVAENLAKRFGNTGTAIVTNGLKFPDALSIAPYAAKKGFPILLTTDKKVPLSTQRALRGKKNTFVIGGEGSVGKEVFKKLPAPKRIGGADRFEVSANIIRQLYTKLDGAYLATGLSFADALTGSVMAAKENAPLLLTRPDVLPAFSNKVIQDKKIKEFVVLGGKGSVQENIEAALSTIFVTSPVIYFVPHADDEVLTYAIDIRNQMSKGRKVILVLLSKGEDSSAREVLNGIYDAEPSEHLLTGQKVYCGIHKTYHDPVSENYLNGYLTELKFGDVRVEEFYHAAYALGVPRNQTMEDIIPLNEFRQENIKPVLQKYINMYPDADFRTMSMYDDHSPHAEIGKSLRSLENEGAVSPFKTLYFVSIYTDRFARVHIPYQKYSSSVEKPFDKPIILNSMKSYGEYRPKQGRYAIGYHSVASQFNSLEKSMYTRFHH
ncbi:cell wall-binding repeat-containing protein [Fictibacillus norfolkensis]|uniref:Cell wall-binding repeat-containing protein n=1 Tax=Fictibacillus norfolkensis TaxID=2762233 RepID=A0ABR8SI67_9BACL|nr:cell wall-binding repeat-containing protein [Fictibacillus norfolkensis]MBD7963171.1 cell wall-binding repeat-containing protein [Fictibacillus norfolkensis]